MKTLLIAALVAFLGVNTAQGAIALLKSTKIAEVGNGDQIVTVSRIVDGDVTCYVTRQGQYGSHAISCVK